MSSAAIRRGLDEEPGNMELLTRFARAATDDESLVDELFDRFERAAEVGDRRPILWSQVCHAALFGRLDLVGRALDDPDFLIPGDRLRRAKVGGLMLELGRTAAADKLLAETDYPLATYHLWRHAVRDGNRSLAATLEGQLPREGSDRLLSRVAACARGIGAGALDAARELVDWWKGPADMARTASHLGAEIILIEVALRLAEGRQDEAIGATIFLLSAPARYDPSAILRATALLGPLPKRFG